MRTTSIILLGLFYEQEFVNKLRNITISDNANVNAIVISMNEKYQINIIDDTTNLIDILVSNIF